jgi:TRAP-type transport system periplasmic protein
MKGGVVGLVALAAVLASQRAGAEEDFLFRLANVSPEGSPWARELKAFARAVDSATGGHFRIKWYLGGVTGDEAATLERIKRGQLDGDASGGMMCERVSPSLSLTRLVGVFQSRDEAGDVMNRLQPTLEAEAHQNGFVLTATTGMGPSVIFTRVPVHSMEELRKLKLWRWDLDDVGIATMREMGLNIVPLPIEDAGRAYDAGQIDGFLTIPAAALAFQWLTRARYVTDLRGNYIWGCFVIAERSFNRLPPAYQAAFRESSAVLRERFDDLGRRLEEMVLGGKLEKGGGPIPVPVSASFRADYFASARSAREKVSEKYVSRGLLDRALRMLADFRARAATGQK